MFVGIAVGLVVVFILAFVLVAQPWKSTPPAVATNPTPTAATTGAATAPTAGASTVNTSGQPQHITVQHILIGFKDAIGFGGSPPAKAAARTQDQAKTLAYQVLDMAKKGQDYDALVTQYTDDSPPGIYKMANSGVTPSGTDEYSRDGMVPAFGNVGFTLQVGEIGIADYDPTTSPYGWHIIKRIN
jgi:PPIC-type PPIASE domain